MRDHPTPVTCDAALVIIGAGFSGVTALTIARHYIPKPEKIVIADVRSSYGGQWIDAYDFVKLHQPYGSYTSYDETWTLDGKPPEHLATRKEVLTHLQDVGRRAGADELFGYRYIGHKKVKENNDLLEVSFEAVRDEDNIQKWENDRTINQVKTNNIATIKIRTKRLINCRPVLHQINASFRFSSSKPKSIDIRELSADIANDNGGRKTHYVIIGSGKSAMDAINYIHDKCDLDHTPVSMIAGNGVAFLPREAIFPVSWFERNFGSTDSVSFLLQYGLKWNGINQASLMREMEENGHLISAVANPSSCMYGVLSQAELRNVKECVGEIIKGRMTDIVDSDDGNGIEIELGNKKGKVPLKLFRPEQRTVVVNCTELTKQEGIFRPLVVDGGKTLDVQLIFVTPGASVTFLTHAWFLGNLSGGNSIIDKLVPSTFPNGEHEKDIHFFKSAHVTVNNLGVMMGNLPLRVYGKDKNNPLSWFPWWRQVRAMSKIVFAKPQAIEFCKTNLSDLKFPLT